MNALVILIVVAFLIMLEGCTADSADSALTWDNPTTNEDGTPLGDLAGIKVYRDVDCSDPQLIATLGVVESYTDANIPGGQNCYMVTAFDTSGNESAYSNQAIKVNDVVKPSAPSGLGVG